MLTENRLKTDYKNFYKEIAMSATNKTAEIIATYFGLGLSPKDPGPSGA